MNEIKKRIERFNLDRFFEVIKLPIEAITDAEEPDFICRLNGESLGVELTSLKNIHLSEICGIQKKIVQNAKKIAEKDLPAIEVTVWFSSMHNRYKQKEKNAATNYIYDVVKRQIDDIKNNNGSLTKIKIQPNKYGLHQIVAYWNTINGKRWLKKHRWQTSEPGWVSVKFHNELQSLINEKNVKYSNYTKKCDKCWLIITVDRSNRDEMFEFERDMIDTIFQSCFDAVYFFDIMLRKIYQLKIK